MENDINDYESKGTSEKKSVATQNKAVAPVGYINKLESKEVNSKKNNNQRNDDIEVA